MKLKKGHIQPLKMECPAYIVARYTGVLQKPNSSFVERHCLANQLFC